MNDNAVAVLLAETPAHFWPAMNRNSIVYFYRSLYTKHGNKIMRNKLSIFASKI